MMIDVPLSDFSSWLLLLVTTRSWIQTDKQKTTYSFYKWIGIFQNMEVLDFHFEGADI